MSSPVFVIDADGRPLMPMAPAFARKLTQSGKARFISHYAFTILQLSRAVEAPKLRPITVYIEQHAATAEIIVVADGARQAHTLLHIIVDLHTDISRRLRRRAGHRRRRHARQRYHAARCHGVPYKRRRPSIAKSTWGRQHPGRKPVGSRRNILFSPLIRWRAEAIVRVVQALHKLVPISHITICDHLMMEQTKQLAVSHATRKDELTQAYAIGDGAGRPHIRCHYCGAEDELLQVEHVVPRSRGGSDAWNNLVFACEPCNQRKGTQTATEAGLKVDLLKAPRPNQVRRGQTQRRLTVSELYRQLRALFVTTVVNRERGTPVSKEDLLRVPLYVAAPIARPRKQVFSSRNYPLTTPINGRNFVHHGNTVKRRVRVNIALALPHGRSRREAQVLHTVERNASGQIIVIGMLCQAVRNGNIVTGIVAAIHSTGRLTLRTPLLDPQMKVSWVRTTITALQTLRVLSRERVLFFKPAPFNC